jgi:hypothetical protein
MKSGGSRGNNHSQPFVLLVSLLYRKYILNPDAIPEHDLKCCVRVCDMHATYPVAKMSGVPCSQEIFELNQVLLDDPFGLFPAGCSCTQACADRSRGFRTMGGLVPGYLRSAWKDCITGFMVVGIFHRNSS